jgi:predicted alpha/beta-fold hydrolase
MEVSPQHGPPLSQKGHALSQYLFLPDGLEVTRRIKHHARLRPHTIVARYGGFADADDYYQTVASSRWAAANLAVPALIIHALDDPFIRMLPSTRSTLLENDQVTFIETRHGGHCAFLSDEPGTGVHWAEKTLVDWVVGLHHR